MIPLFNTDGSSTCPLGLAMCQNRMAVPTWSYAMEVLPPARIVELGTYSGGLTIALAVHAWNLVPRATVTSYDQMVTPREQYAPLGAFLGINFRGGVDIWACEAEIAALIAQPGTSYVLCDGGNKPRELMMFSRYLKPGDVIAGHDYCAADPAPEHQRDPARTTEIMGQASWPWWPWGELSATDGAAAATTHDLEPWMQPDFDMAGWLTYRKRGAS